MYLSIVETGFSKQAGRVPENPASPNAKKAPASSKSSPARPKPQEMDDEVCTAHHHHPASLVLKPLRGARLVRYRKEGRQVFYRLHDHHVVDLYRTVQEHLAE
ncbi:MAG: hypothetical protein MUF13_17690 [Akkermansiaceae bacterium]|nr:hypothetical protein [Akkermansiaceae bacterium]